MAPPGSKVPDGARKDGTSGARRATTLRGRDDGVCERPGRRAGCEAAPGRGHGTAGRCTCFRGSCRDSSGCWAAARISAPRRSHPPRCSLAPFHPRPAIPARRGASRRPPSGPVSPPNRSPAAVQSSAAGLVRLPALVHLRSAGFPGLSGEDAGPEGLPPAGPSGRTQLPLRKNVHQFYFNSLFTFVYR